MTDLFAIAALVLMFVSALGLMRLCDSLMV